MGVFEIKKKMDKKTTKGKFHQHETERDRQRLQMCLDSVHLRSLWNLWQCFPPCRCDCLDLSRLCQYPGEDVVKGTASICSEILGKKVSPASNLLEFTWISHVMKKLAPLHTDNKFIEAQQFTVTDEYEKRQLFQGIQVYLN